ncbi:hypothetical protein CVT25_012973 [Psilocybe cyanescens]|uniref:Uncharacterized protein n=1 Tax=Psilocybe cyanescens TaxID=93625 RepID=A0A409VTT8_PSICY|nr:hypothetical protein CVT25_012973 [Psilocybe cyanescens]
MLNFRSNYGSKGILLNEPHFETPQPPFYGFRVEVMSCTSGLKTRIITAWGQAEYPYARYDLESSDEVPLRVSDTEVHVSEVTKLAICVANIRIHHVTIKAVRADTDELKILDFLKRQSLATLEENCIIPVLDIYPPMISPSW